MEETTNASILEDIQHEIILEPVSPGIRFANYIIDLIVFYAGAFVCMEDQGNLFLIIYMLSCKDYLLYPIQKAGHL